MRTNSRPSAAWIALAILLVPGAALTADGGPAPAAETPPKHVERLVPVFRPVPEYPRRAVRDGVNGFVEFQVTVNPDGTVRDLRVIQAEPPGMFEAAASKAMLKWKFKPKLVDGKAVESAGTQRVEFYLAGSPRPGRNDACEKSRKPARKAGTMSSKKIDRLEAALALVSKPDLAGAEAALLELLGHARNDYERAVFLQALGYVYVKQQKDDQAASSYEQALASNSLSWPVHDDVTFTLAKLHLVNGRQEQGTQLLDSYLREACKPSADAIALKRKLSGPALP